MGPGPGHLGKLFSARRRRRRRRPWRDQPTIYQPTYLPTYYQPTYLPTYMPKEWAYMPKEWAYHTIPYMGPGPGPAAPTVALRKASFN